MAGLGIRAVLRNSTGLTAVLLLAPALLATASEPWAEITIRPEDLVGTLSCSGTSCHGSLHARQTSGTVSQQEFVLWLGGGGSFHDSRRHYDPRAQRSAPTGDPHAHAAWRMQQPRYQEVLRRASVRSDGSRDTEMETRCARCHDPLAAKYSVLNTQHASPESDGTTPYQPFAEHGIGCESCHGGARRWLATHYERDISREQLHDQGMIDTKNLLVRARVCASCHVGSAENDMNHDMLAAGHPPLRFELASYEALLGRKHWDDRPRRAIDPDYEFQLWAAGRVAAAEAALNLLESRASQKPPDGKPPVIVDALPKPWPEFAEFNCFACHQELKPPGTERVEKLAWRSWDVSLASLIMPRPHQTTESLANVRVSFANSLMLDAAQIAHAAAQARATLVEGVRFSDDGVVLDQANRPLAMQTVLQTMQDENDVGSWEDACHQLAAMAAVRRSLIDRGFDGQSLPNEQFTEVAAALRFSPADARHTISDERRRKMLATQLKQLAGSLLEVASQLQSTSGRESAP